MINLFNWRSKLVRDITGDVLEIGIGTGANLPHYRHADSVTGIEPDAARAEKARAQSAKVPVTIETSSAEDLPFADNSFDSIVSSLVLCSVKDQHRALQEMRRVLKPGCTLHMVEHVKPTNYLAYNILRVLTPMWSKAVCNCHLDRPTIEVLDEMSWDVEIHSRRFMFVHMSAVPAPEPRQSAYNTSLQREFYEKGYTGQAKN